jgi:hypothetical protein
MYYAEFVFGLVMSIACWLVFKSFVRALQALPVTLSRPGLSRA